MATPSPNLADAYQRAVSQGRFEGSEREGGADARARAQLAYEVEQQGKREAAAQGAFDERVQQFGTDQASILAQQRAEQEASVQAFQDRIASFERPEAMFSRLEAERGVPGMREQASDVRQRLAETETLLQALPEDIRSRTAGTLTTEAQNRRIQAKESQPLQSAITQGARELEVVSGDMRDALAGISETVQFALVGQQQILEGDKLKIASTADILARELTAFNQKSQVELDSLLQKLNRQQSLTDQQTQRMFDLAAQEAQFAAAKENVILQATLNAQSQENKQEFERELAELGYDKQFELAEIRQGFDLETLQKQFEYDQQLARLSASLRSGPGARTPAEQLLDFQATRQLEALQFQPTQQELQRISASPEFGPRTTGRAFSEMLGVGIPSQFAEGGALGRGGALDRWLSGIFY